MTTIEGFWLPQDIRDLFLSPGSETASLSYCRGKPCLPDEEGSVTAFWPRLSHTEWQRLLKLLRENRRRVPRGVEFWERLQAALARSDAQLADEHHPLHKKIIGTVPAYTGFSEPMIRSTVGALQLMSWQAFPAIFQSSPPVAAARSWQPVNGNPGRVRYFGAPPALKLQSYLPPLSGRPLFHRTDFPELVVGFGAGNVPGNGLLTALLSLASTLAGQPAPAVVIRNSRQEPIFTPIVLDAIQQFDPDLVCSTAVLVWEYEDILLQEILFSQAQLVVAAASDETILYIQRQIQSTHPDSRPRFHAHGHKVSFTAIAREIFASVPAEAAASPGILEITAFLAALDSIFWDQFGCLSARLHFVETTAPAHAEALEYCRQLQKQLSLLAKFLPRGAWPRQSIHNSYDRYRQLEATGKVSLFSQYDDEYMLVLDEREFNPAIFISQVNECQGRIVVVRPVNDLSEIHRRYLTCLPSSQLQSVSLAAGHPGEVLDERLLRFAQGCGARGVTAIRTVGRAAFPQLAYSWDGLLPLDMVFARQGGYFTTIEFDRPYDQIIQTHRVMVSRWVEGGQRQTTTGET